MVVRIGSLFSGIAGFELGLERGLARCGIESRVEWQVEIDPFCRAVLAKHYPDTRRFDDVRSVGHAVLRPVDLVCGGFPCQDLSTANTRERERLDGSKSGLWREYRRILGELRPSLAVIENSGMAWRDWVPVVRRDLHELGYASLPLRVCSAGLGAPHDRDRVFVVADTDPQGERVRAVHAQVAELRTNAGRFTDAWRNPFAGPVRVDDGVPGELDEVRGYGNAVAVPCAELVGYALGRALTA